MAWWLGFERAFLEAIGATATSRQIEFLTDWNVKASSDCSNNPLDISRANAGSMNCRKLTSSRTAQNYTTHTQAQSAFRLQVESGNFPHLLAALRSDNPYTYKDTAGVEDDLRKWGSGKFADYYVTQVSTGPPAPPPQPPPNLKAPQALRGWKDLQRSINHKMPAALKDSERYRHEALRKLVRARKVLK